MSYSFFKGGNKISVLISMACQSVATKTRENSCAMHFPQFYTILLELLKQSSSKKTFIWG